LQIDFDVNDQRINAVNGSRLSKEKHKFYDWSYGTRTLVRK